MCFSMLAQCIAFAFQDMGPELFGFFVTPPPTLDSFIIVWPAANALCTEQRSYLYLCCFGALLLKMSMENLENFWQSFPEVQCFSLTDTIIQGAEWHYYVSIRRGMGLA